MAADGRREPSGTAFRVETARLVMRPYAESDAEARRELIDANDAHLRPWIPWMRDEPMSLAATRELLRGHAERFRRQELFRYVILEGDSGRMIGETGLYPRIGPDALEAGYLVDRRACGKGYAQEAASAMIRVAFAIERVSRVELHCASGNTASIAIPRKLGFTLRETVRETEGTDLQIWELPAEAFSHSAAARVPVSAWSSGNERLL